MPLRLAVTLRLARCTDCETAFGRVETFERRFERHVFAGSKVAVTVPSATVTSACDEASTVVIDLQTYTFDVSVTLCNTLRLTKTLFCLNKTEKLVLKHV